MMQEDRSASAQAQGNQKIINAETLAPQLQQLEEKLADGLRFSNLLGFSNQENTQENKITLYALVELLISKGVIRLHELEQRKQQVAQSLRESGSSEPKVYLVDAPDKHQATDTVTIDCEERYPLCKAACCKLWFALSIQDLDEGIVRWNYAHPYGIAQNADGYCVHKDCSSSQCTIYENRPHVCRTYDCRNDQRIWLDFEKRIINPAIGQDGNSRRVNSESR